MKLPATISPEAIVVIPSNVARFLTMMSPLAKLAVGLVAPPITADKYASVPSV